MPLRMWVDSKFRRTVQFAYVFDPNHDILTQTDAPGLLFLTPGAVSETMKTKFDAPFHIMVPFFEHTVAKTAKKWCHKHVTAYFLLGIGHIHLKKVTDSLEMNVLRSGSKDYGKKKSSKTFGSTDFMLKGMKQISCEIGSFLNKFV